MDCPKERQHGGLAIATIASNPQWPGAKSVGLNQRLGYAQGQNPNDDQILFDVVLHIPGGLVDGINEWFAENFNASIVVPAAGDLANTTDDDKRWLAMVFLKRLTNPDPPQEFTLKALGEFAPTGDWRLLNELLICPETGEGKFSEDVRILRRKSEIGPTPYTNFAELEVDVNIGNTTIHVTVGANAFGFKLWLNTADPADENDKLVAGKQGDSSIMHRTAGRIGPALEPYEKAFLPKRAPAFSSEITFTVQPDSSLAMSDKPSWDLNCIWPTAHIDRFDAEVQKYQRVAVRQQGQTPFVCFLDHGTPWS